MPTPTDQTFFNNNEDSAKRKPLNIAAKLQQKQEKLNDEKTTFISEIESSIRYAHFAVGEVVMKNPELWALIQPHLDRFLKKGTSKYDSVNDYSNNTTEVAELKKQLRRNS